MEPMEHETDHENRLHEARLLALVEDWHIRREEGCSNAYTGQRADFRLQLALYDYESPGAARAEARIYDDSYGKRVPIALKQGKNAVEAIEAAAMAVRLLGHKL